MKHLSLKKCYLSVAAPLTGICILAASTLASAAIPAENHIDFNFVSWKGSGGVVTGVETFQCRASMISSEPLNWQIAASDGAHGHVYIACRAKLPISNAQREYLYSRISNATANISMIREGDGAYKTGTNTVQYRHEKSGDDASYKWLGFILSVNGYPKGCRLFKTYNYYDTATTSFTLTSGLTGQVKTFNFDGLVSPSWSWRTPFVGSCL